jgi:cytochrome c peroxidase
MSRYRVLLALAGLVLAGFTLSAVAGFHLPNLLPFRDPSGTFRTLALGPVDLSSPFFDDLGTNGRSCASCHDASEGWSITPPHLQQRFQITQGQDPVFRPVDGANCPSADVSTVAARTSAYSLLLSKGLIRMSFPVPDNADFSITSIKDPYSCPETTASRPALYRRPLPSTNLRFLTGIMWDGREPNLRSQANNAILVHTQPTHPPADAQLRQIVGLETSLFTAQSEDDQAGNLISQGARGGPIFLALQPFRSGINSGANFNPNAFNLYAKWANASGTNAAARQSIARGEVLFNTRAMLISGVAGFNDVLGQDQVMATCTTCHNAPNVGSGTDSRFAMMNIGTTSPTAELPLYAISCNDGTQVTTTDPGRAMITGKCVDIGKFKTPGLRDLAARAPYFHNGSAATLQQVVSFYDQRFNMGLSPDETADLVAFLSTL